METNDCASSHDKLREVAYAELSPSSRRLLHRRAAQVLERNHPRLSRAKRSRHWSELAHHWEQAKEWIPARQCYLNAAPAGQRTISLWKTLASTT